MSLHILVKVDKFIFLVDFVVLDMDDDESTSLILGRSFLNTTRALIDISCGKLTLRLNDEKIEFDVFNSMRNFDRQEVFKVDCIARIVEHDLNVFYSVDPLENCISGSVHVRC